MLYIAKNGVLMQNSTPKTKGKFCDALSVNIPNKE
jgi:hypothetical protein